MERYPVLLEAVTAYIRKADDDLVARLSTEGFLDPEGAVEEINALEDELASVLSDEKELFVSALTEQDDVESFLDEAIDDLFAADTTAASVTDTFQSFFNSFVASSADSYIKEVDAALEFSGMTARTTQWVSSWAEELGLLMQLSSHDKIQTVLSAGLENGTSITGIAQMLQDAYSFSESRARTTAITEVLTAHSYARQEAIVQSPAVDRKEWRHTGSHKNEPRKHHQAMDGQIVGKEEKFVINAPNGTYECDFPRDTTLPASERVNCHCIHRGVVDDDILGLSVEERRAMQAQAISDDDEAWKAELNAQNKAAAGINEETITYDWLQSKSKDEQINYFGGVKAKWALMESGVISDDAGLQSMFKTVTYTKNGVETSRKSLKTLQELSDDGIITVKNSVLKHAVQGEYKAASKPYPDGRMVTGGHGVDAKNLCDSKGISYEITGTFSNGVTIGNVPSSKLKIKRTESGQAWFPDTWTSDDILVAGTAVANSDAVIDGYHQTGTWNDVSVRVLFDADGAITTICPDLDQNV